LRRQVFLLDTGPLQEYLALQFEKELAKDWICRQVKFVSLTSNSQTERNFLLGRFENFFSRHQGRLWTTATVLVEVQWLARRVEDGLGLVTPIESSSAGSSGVSLLLISAGTAFMR